MFQLTGFGHLQQVDLYIHVWTWELDYKESWAPKNWCFWTVVLEKTLESPLDCKEIQSQTCQFQRKSVLNILWKDWCWSWNSNTLATWWEELTHWKRPWCWERLKVGGEGDDRGWDDWMASPTRWTWVWVSSTSWWWTGKPDVLRSMRVAKSQTWLSDWINWLIHSNFSSDILALLLMISYDFPLI